MQPETRPRAYAIPLDRLRMRCDPASLRLSSTVDLAAPDYLMGQERAREALEFGLAVPDKSQNVFVAGPPGYGRSFAARQVAEKIAAQHATPGDWCYVYNFETPTAPRALGLPAGRARPFARAVDAQIEAARQSLREAFDSQAYRAQRNELLNPIERARNDMQVALELFATEHHFIVRVEDGDPNFLPMKPPTEEGAPPEPYGREDFEILSREEKEAFDADFELIQEVYASARARARVLGLQARDLIRDLDRATAQATIQPLFAELQNDFRDASDVRPFLEQMQEDILAQPARLIEEGDGGDGTNPAESADATPNAATTPMRYRVNVVVDRTGQAGAPCIVELNPTYYNLMGRIEFTTRAGNLYNDHTFIRAGALHQANGGFLILHARELLSTPRAWDALKRALRMDAILIENITDPQQTVTLSSTIKPDSIPLDVRIVLIGELGAWDAINEGDSDFAELFKVRADITPDMPRTPQTERFYAQFAGETARQKSLPPFSATAIARLIEEGARMAGDQTKLSTYQTGIRDLVIEAGFLAQQSQVSIVEAAQVDQATYLRRRRQNFLSDRMDEQVRRGATLIATSGWAIGQINALSVLTALGSDFARTIRIAARTFPGDAGVMNIEREIQMSGPSHSKGILTLAGYLAGQYGQEHPLSLSATIAFEQVYSPVEGDSASMAELIVILSALANLPLRQDLAITGSVNQWGEVQSIGGVTQKVEGFFDLCQSRGLTGTQGVIIPEVNIRNLMLRLDILEAIRQGAFHVFAMRYLDDAIELLMGRPAGKPGPNGVYLQGTVNALVSERLRVYAERVRAFQQR